MLDLKNVSLIRNERYILKDISFSILKNENWTILGKNGSGKTTLINIIFGYLWPTSGIVKVLEKVYGEYPLKDIQRKIGILQSSYQEERIQRNLTIRDIIYSGMLNTIGIYGELSSSEKAKVDLVIKENSWIKNPEQPYSQLSSGEKKKVLLLRALISDPEILILDEPCSSLDLAAREDFFSLLKAYKSKNQSIILITHRTDEIPDYFEHALLLREGKIIASGRKKDVFTSKNLSDTFGVKVNLIEQDGQYFTKVFR